MSKISVQDLAALLTPCQLPVLTGEAAYDCPSIPPSAHQRYKDEAERQAWPFY